MAHYEDIIYDSDKLKCILCSVYIDDDNYKIEAHIKGASHRAKEVRRILVRNSVVIKDNNFYCYACERLIEKLKLREHIQNLDHEKAIQQIKETIKNDGIFLRIPEESSGQEMTIGCVLCDCLVPFNLESVTTHVNSDKHRRARAIAVQPLNGIFSVEGSNYLWCKFCNVYFENFMETIFEHIDNDTDHKVKITKILNLIKDQNITIEKFLMDPKEYKAQCNKCNRVVACNVDNLASYIKGKLHNK